MSKKKIIIAVVVVLIGGAYFYYRSQDTGPVTPTETVKRGDVAEIVSVTGTLVPEEYADLSFPATGVIDRIFISKGDRVEKDDVIASLNASVLASQIAEARMALRVAEENEKLARRGWEDLKPEERAAKKIVTDQARENVRTLLAQKDNLFVSAPFGGIVTKLDTRVGETVIAGTDIARVSGEAALIAEARVPESDIVSVKAGMRADIKFDALSPEDVLSAEIIAIDPAATIVQDVVSYKVRFRMTDPDARLKEGMTADIDIKVAEANGVLTVPFRSLSKEAGKTYAQVKQADETFKKTEVVVGIESDEGTVEIKSGLKEGDQVSVIGRQQ
jgi:RND family efflux transporter MFP subunit